jgi:hypothetical protein
MTPHRRSHYPRLDNLISWFVASIMVAASVIYAFKLQDEPRKPATQRLPPRATPAQEPLSLQEVRAAERGRGRQAHKPMQISRRGWTDIFVRTYREIQSDRLLALAAGVVFYFFRPNCVNVWTPGQLNKGTNRSGPKLSFGLLSWGLKPLIEGSRF